MIPELGHFALVLAFCLALAQAGFALAGAHLGRTSWMNVARPAAAGQFVFVALSFGCLAWAFLHNDFSVLYVAQNSNSLLPEPYRLAAVWGGHEGSLLLWILVQAAWTVGVCTFSRSLPPGFAARVVGVLGLVSAGFMLFALATSNPFDRLIPAAADGRDLNPVLQDPALARLIADSRNAFDLISCLQCRAMPLGDAPALDDRRPPARDLCPNRLTENARLSPRLASTRQGGRAFRPSEYS